MTVRRRPRRRAPRPEPRDRIDAIAFRLSRCAAAAPPPTARRRRGSVRGVAWPVLRVIVQAGSTVLTDGCHRYAPLRKPEMNDRPPCAMPRPSPCRHRTCTARSRTGTGRCAQLTPASSRNSRPATATRSSSGSISVARLWQRSNRARPLPPSRPDHLQHVGVAESTGCGLSAGLATPLAGQVTYPGKLRTRPPGARCPRACVRSCGAGAAQPAAPALDA